jgi:hypothetical protein
VEGLQCIDRFRRLSLEIPFEEPQDNLIRQEVDDRETVLLNGFYFLAQIEIGRGRGADAPECAGP